MSQFNIREVLERHPIIPVITIESLDQVSSVGDKILEAGIACAEVTLRTPVAFDAITAFSDQFEGQIEVGVGTIVNAEHIEKAKKAGASFMVCPGFDPTLDTAFQQAKVPFIVGVNSPSEVMQAMNIGYDTLKFFPAALAGGPKMLKTYNAVFPSVKFCPTGGINETNYQDYLNLPNVISVGGSWLI